MYDEKKPEDGKKNLFEAWLQEAEKAAKRSGSKNDKLAIEFIRELSAPPVIPQGRRHCKYPDGTGRDGAKNDGGVE